MPRHREANSVPRETHGLDNMGAEFLESLEEGHIPSRDVSRAEDGSSCPSKAGPEPLSRWRNLQPGLRARRFCLEHAQLWRWILVGLLGTAYAAFLLIACLLNFQRALALFVLTCVALVFLAYSLLKRLLGPKLRARVRLRGHRRLSLWFKR